MAGTREPRGLVGVSGQGPAVRGLGDDAALGKRAERGEQVGLADAQGVAELLGRLRARRRMEPFEDARLEWIDDSRGCIRCVTAR